MTILLHLYQQGTLIAESQQRIQLTRGTELSIFTIASLYAAHFVSYSYTDGSRILHATVSLQKPHYVARKTQCSVIT